MKKALLITAALSCLLSCNKDAEKGTTSNEIAFTASDSFSADVITKVNALTSISSFYAAATTGTTGRESALWSGKEFKKANGDTKFSSSGVYWPATQQAIHFYASNLNPNCSGSNVTVNASTDTDVLCAYLETPTWKTVNNLTFNHILARLGRCTITAPSGYEGSNLSITVKPKVSGTYNLRTSAWSNLTESSSAVTVTNTFSGGGSVNDIYLVPDSYTINASYTLTKGTYSETFSKTATVTLAAGRINQISATLPQGNATDLQFTVTVTPWTDNAITATFQ